MATSLLEGKAFYCREWAFGKLTHCLESRRPSSGMAAGVLVTGGPGCGKTALCCELVWPTGAAASRQGALHARLLAHYFCQAHDVETLSLANFVQCLSSMIARSGLVDGYADQLEEADVVDALATADRDPDRAFKTAVLLPLLSIKPPKQNLFILVDSVDESYLQSPDERQPACAEPGRSVTIAELLAAQPRLLPPWLLLVCTARKNSRAVSRLFTGFRKLALDDLRKAAVVRDVQQYILCRLDSESALRRHLSRDTADMLNQLHIKSNGCFLYLQRVLDGVAEDFIGLREIRDIPGTLNGLYLWLCQRLFRRGEFAAARPLLDVVLAARRPLTEAELFSCAYTRNSALTTAEFRVRLAPLAPLLTGSGGTDSTKLLFHHSFAEWLLDVKHCTPAFLCDASVGHGMLALSFTLHARGLSAAELHDFALHLSRSPMARSLDDRQLALWLLLSGADVNASLQAGIPREQAVTRLLVLAGASLPADQPYVVPSDSDTDSAVDDVMLCGAAARGDTAVLRGLLARGACPDVEDDSGQTPLSLSARHGHSEAVTVLLAAGVTANGVDPDGWTALRSAAWGGHSAVVTTLLQYGTDVDFADGDSRTALRAAAWGGHVDVVDQLVSAGADVNLADVEGRTALIAAAYMGHCVIIERLLDAGADIDHADADGRTALSVAALCAPASHAAVVALLLDRGANPAHRDRDGTTPLLVAAFEGHTTVCELLLEASADVDEADVGGRTPLQAAAATGRADVVRLLLFWGAAVDAIDADGRSVLCVAAQQGSADVVQQLLVRGLDEMHRDNAGCTPLHLAAFEGHTQVVELLLEASAHVTEVDNEGRMALLLAAQEGHTGVVEALLGAGSCLEARAHDGRTALRLAALHGHHALVSLLLGRGADTDYRDADGRSTLYVLALDNETEASRLLLEARADSEAADLEGRTPLHVAAWQGHGELTALLLAHGASVDALDREGRTPLQSAAWQGHAGVVGRLLAAGASVDRACAQGATALCVAAQEGHEAVVKELLRHRADPEHADRHGRTAARVALKGGHSGVLRLLGGLSGASTGTTTTTSGISVGVTVSRQILSQAAALADGHLPTSNSASPASSYDRRKSYLSNHSSSNLTASNTASTNQSSSSGGGGTGGASPHAGGTGGGVGGGTAAPTNMSFTQQIQQCSVGRNRSLTRVLSPVSEPASPHLSPAADTATDATDAVWQHRTRAAADKGAAVAMGHGTGPVSPDGTRRKRNGIVTNPKCATNANATVNGYYNQLSAGGGGGSVRHGSALLATCNGGRHPASPHTVTSQLAAAARPNRLSLKKETPL